MDTQEFSSITEGTKIRVIKSGVVYLATTKGPKFLHFRQVRIQQDGSEKFYGRIMSFHDFKPGNVEVVK